LDFAFSLSNVNSPATPQAGQLEILATYGTFHPQAWQRIRSPSVLGDPLRDTGSASKIRRPQCIQGRSLVLFLRFATGAVSITGE
jgi:hypothetical protein